MIQCRKIAYAHSAKTGAHSAAVIHSALRNSGRSIASQIMAAVMPNPISTCMGLSVDYADRSVFGERIL